MAARICSAVNGRGAMAGAAVFSPRAGAAGAVGVAGVDPPHEISHKRIGVAARIANVYRARAGEGARRVFQQPGLAWYV